MLLSRELGVRMGEALSPPAATRRRPGKLGPWALDPRPPPGSPGGRSVGVGGGGGEGDCRIIAAAVGRLNSAEGGRDFGGKIGGFSHESEHDLALLVSDFLEDGSGGSESRYSSDSENGFGFSDLGHLVENILFHQNAMTYETDLLSVVHSIMLLINEVDLCVINEEQCNASCIRQSLVRLLKLSGYDAGICTSGWQGSDKVPGGDHEYIDVVLGQERLIIDIDFHSHFEIARAVESYNAILNLLPVVYVGSLPRLKELLRIMVDAAKFSLKQNSMPLPPWRSLPYLQAKWFSKYDRKDELDEPRWCGIDYDHKQCVIHLQRLKTLLKMEIDSERLLKPIFSDKKWVLKSEKRRPSLLSS